MKKLTNFCDFSLIFITLLYFNIVFVILGIIYESNAAVPHENSIRNRISNNISTSNGLWMYDDNGKLVKASYEVPPLAETENTTLEDKIFFTLYTNEKPEGERLFINDTENLNATKFNPEHETIFITHGWMNSENSSACTLIKDAYLQKGDYNVIIVDWSRIAFQSYGSAASHVKSIGKYVAMMIDYLEREGMDLGKLKLIGHSLGAHMIGSAGYHAKNIINYVVGLDPALPLFHKAQPSSRISTHDAKNVEIIHTNGGNNGFLKPLGHVDFYPNGGQKQVGCFNDLEDACSHARSYELYAESILSDVGFYGRFCANFTMMAINQCTGTLELMGGLKNDLTFRGVYVLETNEIQPFALGREY